MTTPELPLTTFELYPVAGGVGYRVLRDGVPIIDQPFAPEPGYPPMTEAEATTRALADVAALTAQ